MKIIDGIFGLPQVCTLANNLLAQPLHNHRYYQAKITSGLWKHVWRIISFTLVVEHFGIGYVEREHPDHLMSALKMYYENITTYWEGKLYCVITMKHIY